MSVNHAFQFIQNFQGLAYSIEKKSIVFLLFRSAFPVGQFLEHSFRIQVLSKQTKFSDDWSRLAIRRRFGLHCELFR